MAKKESTSGEPTNWKYVQQYKIGKIGTAGGELLLDENDVEQTFKTFEEADKVLKSLKDTKKYQVIELRIAA